MDEVAVHTGRAYRVAEYTGHPEAERVVVIMGSGGETVRETVTHLVDAGERVGVLQLRLYRPFPADELLAALPATVTQVAVLDRTKEPGSNGEPLYLDVLATLAEAHERGDRATIPRVIGGRYGLSSKEFTPGMVGRHLRRARPRRPPSPVHHRHHRRRRRHQPALRPRPRHRGPADPARGLLRPRLGRHGRREQEHHQDPRRRRRRARPGLLRLRLQEVRRPHGVAPALRAAPDPRALPGEQGRLRRLPPPRAARHGRRAGLRRAGRDPAAQRAPARGRGVGRPARAGAAAGDRQAAAAVRRRRQRRRPGGRPARPHQHGAADLLLRDLRGAAAPTRRSTRVKEAIRKTYGRRGSEVVRRNEAAVDATLAALHEVHVPGGSHVVARDARHRARARARVRAHRDRRDDGRPRRRPAGQRDAGRRHLPQRHDRLREAADLRRRRRLGPGRLHPVRHLQLRLPAQRHPVQVLRRQRARGRARGLPVGAAERRRPARRAATRCRSTSRTAPAAACASRRAR